MGLEPQALYMAIDDPGSGGVQSRTYRAVVSVVSGEFVVLAMQQVWPREVATDMTMCLEAPLDDWEVVCKRHIPTDQASPGLFKCAMQECLDEDV
jgi:hypothetical protein